MAKVTIAVDQEVRHLLDYGFVEQMLSDVRVYILFSCVSSDDWADDSWIAEDGTPTFVIKLPIEQVRRMDKESVRELMLEKAQERLRQAA